MGRGRIASALVVVLLLAPAVRLDAGEGGAGANGPELTVATFNVLSEGFIPWHRRREPGLALIRRLRADVLGLQEVAPGQRADLERSLPEYQLIGRGRDDEAGNGEQVPLALRRGRLRVLQSGQLWLSDRPAVAGSRGWDAWFPRVLVWAVVHDVAAGRELLVANTHLDCCGEVARERSAALVHDQLSQLSGGRPVVLVGDFNTGATGAVHRLLVSGPLQDAQRPLGAGGSTRRNRSGRPSGPRIDWILYDRDAFAVEQSRTIDDRFAASVSDHLPVQARLRWRTRVPSAP